MNRCDRILWKSTVVPDPDPEEEAFQSLTRPRNRLGQFLANAFRPLSATLRRDSASSLATSTTATSSISEDLYIPPDILGGSAPVTRVAQPPSPRHRQMHSQSIEHLPVNMSLPVSPTRNQADLGLRRSNSESKTPPQVVERPLRHATASAGLPSTSNPSTSTATSHTPSRWRFLPTFFSLTTPPGAAPTEILAEPFPTAQKKGDVVCLTYHTLDDRGMRKLEGRSDHRPVIGSYIVYV